MYVDGRYVPERQRNVLVRSTAGGRVLSALQFPFFTLLPPGGFGVITTTGRRTGKARRKCIRVIRKGNKAFIVSIPGAEAAWVKNIRANPDIRLRIRSGRLRGIGRELDRPRDNRRGPRTARRSTRSTMPSAACTEEVGPQAPRSRSCTAPGSREAFRWWSNCSHSAPGGAALAGGGSIEGPVPRHGGQPLPVLTWKESESSDRALATFVVAVEQIDSYPMERVDRVARDAEDRLVGIAERPLPEPQVPAGHIEVSGQATKVSRVPVRRSADGFSHEVPTVEHGQAGTYVSQPECQINDVGGHLGVSATSFDLHPVVIGEDHLFRWILEPRRHEYRPNRGQQRAFGDARRLVRRAHRGERRGGEDERPTGSSQCRDGRPVSHPPTLPSHGPGDWGGHVSSG